MDLSLVGTDILLDEIEKRPSTGIIYLAKSEKYEGGDTHRFKTRNWGSPLLRAGMIQIIQSDNDQFLSCTDALDSESW